ncbi:MAG: hypothetical protein ACERKD_10340 [Prolixibacteraceae bacterium]
MNNFSVVIVAIFLFFIACKKDVPPLSEEISELIDSISFVETDTLVEDSTSSENDTLINTLIQGNGCESFYRSLVGPKMEDLNSIQPTNDGGFICCGSTESIAVNEDDILVLKLNCMGETEWLKTFSGEGADFGIYSIQNSNGEYIVSCLYQIDLWDKGLNLDGHLMKMSEDGRLLWDRNFHLLDPNAMTKLMEIPGGNYLSLGNYLDKGLIICIDEEGTEKWRYRTQYYLELSDFTVSADQRILACGSISTGINYDIYLLELNLKGELQWSRKIDIDSPANKAYSIRVLESNEIMVAGTSDASGFVMKLDETGHKLEYRSLRDEGFVLLDKIILGDNNKVLGLKKDSVNEVLMVFNLDNNSMVMEKVLAGNLVFRDLHAIFDDSFVLCGNSFIEAGNRDGVILKGIFN